MANQTRKRSNFKSGTTSDAPSLASGATTMNSAGLANLPAVDSTEVMVLVLDPTGAGNGPEVVWVTAHTASATSATIVRGREGTSGVVHTATTSWIHVATQADYPNHVTSATRPSTGGLPYQGQEIYETDTLKTYRYSGTAWVEEANQTTWDTFTPQLYQNGNITSSTAVGRYRVFGKMAVLHIRNIASASGTAGNAVEIRNIPVGIAALKTGAPSAVADASAVGKGTVVDTGVATYLGDSFFTSSTVIRFMHAGSTAGNFVGVDPSMQVTSSDLVSADIVYEIA